MKIIRKKGKSINEKKYKLQSTMLFEKRKEKQKRRGVKRFNNLAAKRPPQRLQNATET